MQQQQHIDQQKIKLESDPETQEDGESQSEEESVTEEEEEQVLNMSAVSSVHMEEFIYGGEATTLGKRWQTWTERFSLYLTPNKITDPEVMKASFLLLMGREAFEVYNAKRKADGTDTYAEIKAFMNAYFVVKRSEYGEAVILRGTIR